MRARTEAGRGTEVWSSRGWRATATTWIDRQLAGAGVRRTGAVEQPHLRPWATVLRVPTTQGPVWMKASGAGSAFEPALYELLLAVAPERVLVPLAVDGDRGWLLLPDGGPSLGERLSGRELVDALVAALPAYAQLQRALSAHVERMLALGLGDMRPAAMPQRFAQALAAVGPYLEQRGESADRAAYERVAGLGDTVAEWCERLASTPVPASLDHNDLHPWNILDGQDGDPRFYDWGDAVVAHPFATMLIVLRFVPEPEQPRVRDAYLREFGDLASQRELVDALELACRVGKIARALTWHRAISVLGLENVDDDSAGAPLDWLKALLDPSYLGVG